MTTLSQMFNRVAKDNFQFKNGRIRILDNYYAIRGKHPKAEAKDAKRMAGWPPKWAVKEQDGREYVMVSARGVKCPYSELHPDAYRSTETAGSAWIADADCRNCPFRLKGERRGQLRFPRCQRKIDDRADEVLKTGADVLADAIKTVDEMMK